MNYAEQQRNPSKHMVGLGVVIVMHIILGWALLNGLARKVVEVVKGPIETKIIEEVKPPPPPPPENLPPPPKLPPPPPAYMPPPEIKIETPPPPAPTITVQTTPPPPAPPVAIAPPTPPEAPPAPPAPAAPARVAPQVNFNTDCEKPVVSARRSPRRSHGRGADQGDRGYRRPRHRHRGRQELGAVA